MRLTAGIAILLAVGLAGCAGTFQNGTRVVYQKGDDVRDCTSPGVGIGSMSEMVKWTEYDNCVDKLTRAGYQKVREEKVEK